MKKRILTLGVAMAFMAVVSNVEARTTDSAPIMKWNTLTNVNVSSFCKAIIKGDKEMVLKMIEMGEDVNQKSLGKTPAHYAARYNRPEIMKVLIKNGANLNKRCDQGFTVKKYAELADASAVLEVLEKKG
ncbi:MULTISPECIES: ankyrin repeat domain-containing protein [Flavobacteriaceae]|uniref:ankyrin repeat domain-containing protein n=1 Tax=Flavobacteriaceae TaxID=49546 RepID=UPI001F0F7CD9|nr:MULTISPECIES: ankyrin repeat domain-containing protein [Flavobacteriaceae]